MAEPPWPFVRMREAQSLARVIRMPQFFLPFSHVKTRVRVIREYIRYGTISPNRKVLTSLFPHKAELSGTARSIPFGVAVEQLE